MAAGSLHVDTYSKVSAWQYMSGKRLIDRIQIQDGYNVLDIGCGTGELASYLASKVGETGKVLGIDPNTQRIAVAREKFKNIANLSFEEACLSEFASDCCFDVVFSNCVFHWISEDDLVAGLTKIRAQSMTAGASLVFQTLIDEPISLSVRDLLPENVKKVIKESLLNTRTGEDYEKVMKLSGFSQVRWEHITSSFVFASKEDFYSYLYSSTNGVIDVSKIPPDKLDTLDWKYTESGGVIASDVCLAVFVN